MILYCSANRSGATKEADKLHHALLAAGCNTSKKTWNDAKGIYHLVDSALDEIVADCSLLIVCLMAHGSRGMVRGSAGEGIPINNILHQLSYRLPSHVPMVRQSSIG